MSSKPTLGYWDLRGKGQPIRNLLVYVGADFDDKWYPIEQGNDRSQLAKIGQHWFKEKFTLGLDFPNLPYLIDGDLKITQSVAILKYLARKHGLIAKDMATLARQEMVEQQLQDHMTAFTRTVHSSAESYPAEKETYETKTLPDHLAQLGKYLAANEWFTGPFSYVDIMAYELLDRQRLFSPSVFAQHTNLAQFLARFENLPKLKEYFETSKYKNWQLFSPFAQWGYKRT